MPAHMTQRFVEVSDIRPERQTEESVREELSDYYVCRFEKVVPYDAYDIDGEIAKPSWENCVRTRMPEVSKRDAQREIRRLNLDKPVTEKKNSLTPHQQRQLEKALQDFSAVERDHRYHTVLAQIDHQLRPIDNNDKKSRRHSSTRGKSREKKKNKYQRISITAYYRRCPRPEQVPSQLKQILLFEKQQQQRDREMAERQQRLAQEQQAQMAQERHMLMLQQQRDQAMPPPPMQHPGQGQMRPPVHPLGGKGNHQGTKVIKENKDHQRGHSHSSEESYSEDESGSESGSESTVQTSVSSDHSRRRSHHHHSRKSPKYLENPKNFGVDVLPSRHHSIREEPFYVVTGSGTRVPAVPPPPRPAPLGLPVDQIEADAYHAGRADQRAEDRERIAAAERLAEAERLELAAKRYPPRYAPRLAPRPEIVQQRPRMLRHVTESEVDSRLESDFEHGFERLMIDPSVRRRREEPRREESRFNADFDGLLYRENQRRREERLRMDEEAALADEESLLSEEYHDPRREPMRRRESSPVFLPSHNPFYPSRRRMSPDWR